ncbi:DegV family protein [Mycoplasma leonicaptivi]|uniref:DegV family protein n=1 Tax=Mycoplasma leonicaptivi TaxID=36742 RepID=UPI00048933F9|nr:DegV family protein [Mycoplasma leonicaptivi]
MKDIAIVVDSSSGLTKEQANKLGLYFLPLQIELEGQIYNDGIDLTYDNFFNHFSLNTKVAKTSATNLGYASDLLTSLANEYQKVVVFPISSKLSSQFSMLDSIAKDLNNVYIVDSVDIAVTILVRVQKFINDYQKLGFEEAFKNACVWNEDELSITLLPKFNDYLVRGGRLSPAANIIAKLLKVVPLIKFSNGILDKEGKGRVFDKSLINVVDSKIKNKEDKLIFLGEKNEDMFSLIEYVKKQYNIEPIVLPIPNVISIHTGPQAIVIIKTNTEIKDLIAKYVSEII